MALAVGAFVVAWVPLKQKMVKRVKNILQGAGFIAMGLWDLAAGCGGCRQAGSETTGVKLLR